jgi:hypothetical protein
MATCASEVILFRFKAFVSACRTVDLSLYAMDCDKTTYPLRPLKSVCETRGKQEYLPMALVDGIAWFGSFQRDIHEHLEMLQR